MCISDSNNKRTRRPLHHHVDLDIQFFSFDSLFENWSSPAIYKCTGFSFVHTYGNSCVILCVSVCLCVTRGSGRETVTPFGRVG